MERNLRGGGYLYHNKGVLARGVIFSCLPLGLSILAGWPLWIGITLSAVGLAGTVFQFFWRGRRRKV